MRVNLKPHPVLSQGAHVDGPPLGTRGRFVVDHVFPAEGDYTLTFTGPGVGVYDSYSGEPEREDRFIAVADGKIIFDSLKDGPALPPPVPVGIARPRRAIAKVHLT